MHNHAYKANNLKTKTQNKKKQKKHEEYNIMLTCIELIYLKTQVLRVEAAFDLIIVV